MSLFSTNRVLVPIDFSEAAFKALDETLEFVGNPSQIYVIHALAPISPIEPGIIWETVSDKTRIQNVEKAFFQRYQNLANEVIHFKVVIGDASTAIVDYAEEEKMELIVIASRGLTGMNRFLMGSVAERVVRIAPCPVLVLRR